MARPSTNHRPAALGLLAGIVLGGGVSTVLFSVTGDAMAFVLVGICAAAGLLIGAGVESARRSQGSE